MQQLTEKQIIQYLLRSYRATDGLWFMKAEKKYGFASALDLDLEVWKVLPKIQARMIKTMLNLEDNKNDLITALKSKLSVDGFESTLKKSNHGFKFIITTCPWHNLMIKSKREKYSGEIGTKVCDIEYKTWVSEFGSKFKFTLTAQKCKNSKCCILDFKEN